MDFPNFNLLVNCRNGIKQRKNSWQDGVLGTNCPIPPNKNFTYFFQPKDQIGSYTYFPSTGLHRAAGGFGALNVYSRPRIPIPYPNPAGDFTLLIGDWYKTNYKVCFSLHFECYLFTLLVIHERHCYGFLFLLFDPFVEYWFYADPSKGSRCRKSSSIP